MAAAIHRVDAGRVSAGELAQLEGLVHELAPSELRDLLQALVSSVGAGADVAMFGTGAVWTPAQVAERLGMSRTHLYKLLDSGALPSFRVGRDRRINAEDVIEFERNRQRDRRELAERFAHVDRVRAGAIDDLMDEI
ncbi:helix-turn-helix domain-containing protein [Nocardia sp. NPDC058666]|uniref:helix-turn-helix domain-containing protein n=1 Tax=Nocardia sp. NPDC058666 TaxID=3346587 RepID=UPI00364C750D